MPFVERFTIVRGPGPGPRKRGELISRNYQCRGQWLPSFTVLFLVTSLPDSPISIALVFCWRGCLIWKVVALAPLVRFSVSGSLRRTGDNACKEAVGFSLLQTLLCCPLSVFRDTNTAVAYSIGMSTGAAVRLRSRLWRGCTTWACECIPVFAQGRTCVTVLLRTRPHHQAMPGCVSGQALRHLITWGSGYWRLALEMHVSCALSLLIIWVLGLLDIETISHLYQWGCLRQVSVAQWLTRWGL